MAMLAMRSSQWPIFFMDAILTANAAPRNVTAPRGSSPFRALSASAHGLLLSSRADKFAPPLAPRNDMKQVRHYLRNGALDIGEVPVPALGAGDVLVRNHYSFVSVGTEKMKVSQARMSLVQKAKERPDQVKLVLNTLREQGLVPTLRKVQERLKAPTTLGYSCAGTVVAVGSDVDEFRVDDRVACIGEGVATHAEYNAVPRNLVAHVPPNVSLEAASSSAVGAIALQSIRQAKLELGESVAIIGLGLLGQFLVQLCRANGCRVIGVDLDPGKCALAAENGASSACGPQADEALHHTLRASAGLGVDAVLLTASTKDLGPIELAAMLVRDRGRVLCLGNTPIQLEWRTWSGQDIDFLLTGAVRLGQIGAGNYAKSMLMPCFPSLADLSLEGICTTKGPNAEALAKRYGFRKATTDAGELLRDREINAIMVATRHDSHARYAALALGAGKHAYVEKPLAMTEEQLAPIATALAKRGADGPTLWIGHNRRFSPLSQRALAHFKGVEVRQVACTVRSAGVPADSWYQDKVAGGGVLFGDVCHFIDLAIYFAQSLPVEVAAFATPDPGHREESWAITLHFANGGLGVVHYVCGSQKGLDHETIDILGGGRSATITDFRRLILRGGAGGGMRQLQPDLGQKAMLHAMVAQFSRAPGAVDYTDSFLVSAQALLAAHRSIVERRIVKMEPRFPFGIA